MGAPSLEVFKARLDEAMANLIWWVASLPWQGWDRVGFRVLPTQAILVLMVCVCS